MEKLLHFGKELFKDKWNAKHIKDVKKKKDLYECIEIRKNLNGTNVVVVIFKNDNLRKFPMYLDYSSDKDWEEAKREYYDSHRNVRMSMNGTTDLTWDEWWDLNEAVKEALEILL